MEHFLAVKSLFALIVLLLRFNVMYGFVGANHADYLTTSKNTTENPSKVRIVVSLTSIPRRLRHLQSTLKTILQKQYHEVDLVQINLPHVFSRTNTTYDDIDRLHFLHNARIRIVRCKDYGPATKLLQLWRLRLIQPLLL